MVELEIVWERLGDSCCVSGGDVAVGLGSGRIRVLDDRLVPVGCGRVLNGGKILSVCSSVDVVVSIITNIRKLAKESGGPLFVMKSVCVPGDGSRGTESKRGIFCCAAPTAPESVSHVTPPFSEPSKSSPNVLCIPEESTRATT